MVLHQILRRFYTPPGIYWERMDYYVGYCCFK